MPPTRGELFPFSGEPSPSEGRLSPTVGQVPPLVGGLFPNLGELPPTARGELPRVGRLPPIQGELLPKDGERSPLVPPPLKKKGHPYVSSTTYRPLRAGALPFVLNAGPALLLHEERAGQNSPPRGAPGMPLQGPALHLKREKDARRRGAATPGPAELSPTNIKSSVSL